MVTQKATLISEINLHGLGNYEIKLYMFNLSIMCNLLLNLQWKVRRTLAFSMHQLAVIVGEEITHKDLVPVFDGFLKDLDEVRIGVLKHLADIFRVSEKITLKKIIFI